MKNRFISQFKICLFLVFCLPIMACTSIKQMPENAPGYTEVDSCNFENHIKCVNLTKKETISDGLERKWTRHWFRMSYIGKACEREHGRVSAVITESMFAIPHYAYLAIVNSAAAIVSPFVAKDNP